MDPTTAEGTAEYHNDVPGLVVQNISSHNNVAADLLAVVMDLGGHHTDLMYSDIADPPCIREARLVERDAIARWIDQFWENEFSSS